MIKTIVNQLAQRLNISLKQVTAVVELLQDGATVPFIARYRKEATGSLDEVQITNIRDGLQQLEELEKRRAFILKSIEEQGKLTPKLKAKINQAITLPQLEDLYLPYKPKRRTKGTMAKEKGLEPLAQLIFEQRDIALNSRVKAFVNAQKGVKDAKEALQGARDIIAEWVNEDANARECIRQLFERSATVSSKVVKTKEKEEEAATYKDYFEYSESIRRMPSHRFLALMRGTKEGFLRMNIEPEQEAALTILDRQFLKRDKDNDCTFEMEDALSDAYKRLMKPSIATEIRNVAKGKADAEAIEVFTTNLRELLLSAPLGQKRVLGIDPGYRTGCKVVCLNEQGDLLQNTAVYPHDRQESKRFDAAKTLEHLVKRYRIEAIAIGNGTAGRETLAFVKKMGLSNVTIVSVNESGASIYSASEVAREEFPDKDITVRGAVSIGRRLMDPLAELVKIDPKSIGVGQYQHDVNQKQLKQSLDDVVESCVNNVGVEINTASKELLAYVSGLSNKTAQNVIDYRNENGAFAKKSQLKKVKGIGAKAFEQAAGFIRISHAKNPLDASAVHPESYAIVQQMAKDKGVKIADLVQDTDLRKSIRLHDYTSKTVGLPTLTDIMQELAKPGRDPRQQFETIDFEEGINDIGDVKKDMVLTGIVTNVTNFGAFVDIGIKENGLVHVSQLANRFVSDPKTVVKVNQKVKVRVMEVDERRKRIQLSMKDI
ncbi:MAG: Tex family protein [Chitinophagales bacterium]